jgi:hypothetical protein
MEILKLANLALRFLLELCAFTALGYWGFQTGSSLLWRIVLGLGAPLLAIVLWGMFVAPKAAVQVPPAVKLLIELGVFAAAVAALAAARQPSLALLLALVYAVNRILIFVWKQ